MAAMIIVKPFVPSDMTLYCTILGVKMGVVIKVGVVFHALRAIILKEPPFCEVRPWIGTRPLTVSKLIIAMHTPFMHET